MLWFVIKQLFILRRIVSVNSKSRIDCIVLTFVAPHHWVMHFLGIIRVHDLGI